MKAKALVLTASIENEDAIRRWLANVQDECRSVQRHIDELADHLRDAPHIQIHLEQTDGGA